jgi:hypothetical protein
VGTRSATTTKLVVVPPTGPPIAYIDIRSDPSAFSRPMPCPAIRQWTPAIAPRRVGPTQRQATEPPGE